ncbi:MAG: NYN domain-containing protein [Myxococcota bacterium]
MNGERLALLLDGGFVKKRLAEKIKRFPPAEEVTRWTGDLLSHADLANTHLLRTYWYDADPFGQKRKNPIDGKQTNFASTLEANRNRELMSALEVSPDFAVRKGELLFRGWRVRASAMKELATDPPRTLKASDLEPVFIQKSVDMRIGLDIASLALKRLVHAVVLVTADADMIPAMKLARREGLRVYLHTMATPDRRHELLVHADRVLG